MAFLPVQEAFDAGELSKRLRGRKSSEIYKRGLDYCENFEPTPQGSLLMRGGLEYVAAAASPDVRLFEMKTRRFGSYVLELTPLELRIRESISKMLQANAPDLAVGGQFDSNLTGWFEGVQDGASDPYLISPGNWGCRLRRPIADPKTAYLRNKDPFVIAPATDYVLSFEFVKRTQGNARIGVSLGTTEFGVELGTYYFDQVGTCLLPFNSGGAAALEVYFFLDPYEGAAADDVIFDNVQLRVAGGATVLATPWAAEHLEGIQVAYEAATDRAYFAHPNKPPQRLVRNGDGTWTLAALSAVPGSSFPLEWTGSNWPGVIAFVQSRLVLAATPAEGHRVWLSKSAAPQDFGLGTALDAEGIDLKVATSGALNWIRGSRQLLAGTDIGEHSFVAAKGALTPTDHHVLDESEFGSGPIQAVHAGTLALYVSNDLKKVRGLQYDLQTSGWNSKDVTFTAEHIAPLIKELHYSRTPIGSILALLHEGRFGACTFDPGEGVAAWWRFTTRGTIKSAAVSNADGSIWAAVERAGGTYIERYYCAAPGAYLDSYVTKPLAAGQTVVTGLGHLEGEVVKVILDGAMEPDATVVGGEIVLGREGTTVTVGLPYTVKAVTLPLDLKHAKAQVSKIGAMLNDSALPKFGTSEKSLYRPADRKPGTAQDTPEAPHTGKVKVASIGTDDEAKIIIVQDIPARTEILALYSVTEA